MARAPCVDEASRIYNARKRGNLRATIFQKVAGYIAFRKILGEALERYKLERYKLELLSFQFNRYRTTSVWSMQNDEHFLVVCRYVERNAKRAGLVDRGEQWQWGLLWPSMATPEPIPELLSPWPIPLSSARELAEG